MSENSMSELHKKLQQKAQSDREATEQIMTDELTKLSENFKKQSNAALSTILSDIHSEVTEMKSYLSLGWIKTVVMGLAVTMGVGGGAWGVSHYLTTEIQQKMETIERYEAAIEKQKKTAKELGGLGLSLGNYGPGKVYLALPKGSNEPEVYKAKDGRWVVHLK